MTRNEIIYTICKLNEEGMLALNSTSKENCTQVIHDWENKWSDLFDDLGVFLIKIMAILLLVLLITAFLISLVESLYRSFLRMKYEIPEEVWKVVANELDARDWDDLNKKSPQLCRKLRRFQTQHNDEERRKKFDENCRFKLKNPKVQPQENIVN
jgi:Na+-transporting methylmalonyl-CoA/oxaloacetate decarboxylase gamma subunit